MYDRIHYARNFFTEKQLLKFLENKNNYKNILDERWQCKVPNCRVLFNYHKGFFVACARLNGKKVHRAYCHIHYHQQMF